MITRYRVTLCITLNTVELGCMFMMCCMFLPTASTNDHHQTEAGRRGGRRSTLSRTRAGGSGQTVGESPRAGQNRFLLIYDFCSTFIDSYTFESAIKHHIELYLFRVSN